MNKKSIKALSIIISLLFLTSSINAYPTENMVTYMDPADGTKYTISYSRFVSYWNECLYSIR